MSPVQVDAAGGGASIWGDPDAVEEGARAVRKAGERMAEAGRSVKDDADTVVASWEGKASGAAHEHLRHLAQRTDVAAECITEAPGVLQRYARELRAAQQDLARGIEQAAEARQRASAARTRHDQVTAMDAGDDKNIFLRAADTEVSVAAEMVDDAVTAIASAVEREAVANRDAAQVLGPVVDRLEMSPPSPGGPGPTIVDTDSAVVRSEHRADTLSAAAGAEGPVGVEGGASGELTQELQVRGNGTAHVDIGFGLGVTGAKKLAAGLPGAEADAKAGLGSGGSMALGFDFEDEAAARRSMERYGGVDGLVRLAEDTRLGLVLANQVSYQVAVSADASAAASAKVSGADVGAEAQGSADVTVDVTRDLVDGSYVIGAGASAGVSGALSAAGVRGSKSRSKGWSLQAGFDKSGTPTDLTYSEEGEGTDSVAVSAKDGPVTTEVTGTTGERLDKSHTLDLTDPAVAGAVREIARSAGSGDPDGLLVASATLAAAAYSVEPDISRWAVSGSEGSVTVGGEVLGLEVEGKQTSTEETVILQPVG